MERWAELRREHFVRGVSIKELMRRTGWLATRSGRRCAGAPPGFRCPERPSKLDPFKAEICELLREDHKLTGVRIRELIEPLGYPRAARAIVDDYLREVRPLFAPKRTFQRTVYRPGEICQFDLWKPKRGDPGRLWSGPRGLRRGCVSWLFEGRCRARWCSPRRPLICSGASLAVCGRWERLPSTLVWDREGALHAHRGRPTDVYAAFCGQLKLDWHFCGEGDPQAKGAVEKHPAVFRDELRARQDVR